MSRLPGLLRVLVVVFAATVTAVSFTGGRAMAGSVTVADGSHVLSRSDVGAVTDAASHVGSDAVHVYTTTGLAGDDAAFDEHYAEKLATAGPATIIIGVNTRSEHVTVHGGTGAHLHRRQSAAAVAAFTGGLRVNHRYGDALVAMLQSLQESVTGRQATTGNGNHAAAGGAHATTPSGAHAAATTAGGAHAAAGGAPAATPQAKKTLSAGRIAVIAVGALVVLAIVVGISRAIFRGRGRSRGQWV